MSERICVVGLGEVGGETYMAIQNKLFGVSSGYELVGVDKDESKKGLFKGRIESSIPESDIYIVCVYTEDQVREVYDSISKENSPLIIIESTIGLSLAKSLQDKARQEHTDERKTFLAACPHRLVPGDDAHKVFNIPRVLGAADEDAYEMANDFYIVMGAQIVRAPNFVYACVTKVVENAYRFCEIAIAQEFALALQGESVNPNTVFELANTKWNIDIRQPRDGVKGKCLPKDMEIFAQSTGSEFLKYMIERNESYKKLLERKKK